MRASDGPPSLSKQRIKTRYTHRTHRPLIITATTIGHYLGGQGIGAASYPTLGRGDAAEVHENRSGAVSGNHHVLRLNVSVVVNVHHLHVGVGTRASDMVGLRSTHRVTRIPAGKYAGFSRVSSRRMLLVRVPALKCARVRCVFVLEVGN